MHALRWLALPALLLLAACGSGGGTPALPSAAGTYHAASALAGVCRSAPMELRISLQQDGGRLYGYVQLTLASGPYDWLGAFEGQVSSSGEITGQVTFGPGFLGAGKFTANLTLVNDQLLGTITGNAPEYCGDVAPDPARIVVDTRRTSSAFTAPPAIADLTGTWRDGATSVDECGTVSPVEVELRIEQSDYGMLRGVAELTTTADLPRFTLLAGYLTPQGLGLLLMDAGDWGGEVLLEVQDGGGLAARFQYGPFACGGVPHAKVVEAALVR